MKESAYTAIPAFLAGGLIGAGMALFLAPQSGSQLRGMLRGYGNNSMKHAGPEPETLGRRPRKRKAISKAPRISEENQLSRATKKSGH
jgi:gas vesicle protein